MNKNRPRHPSILIIGTNGFIGQALYNHFYLSGWKPLGISHRPGALFQFDLYHPDFSWLEKMGRHLDYAVICSAISNIERCKKDPSTHELNVTNTIHLIDHLYRHNITPVFLSSNMVFKGTTPYYHEEDGRYPTTTYGRQKREVEDYLLASRKPFIIFRLCKVIGVEYQDGSVLTRYLDDLRSGRNVLCARDQYISLTYIKDMVRALQILVEKKADGVFHISSPEMHSRLELAVHIAQFFHLDLQHIVPCFIKDLDFSEPRPQYNSLDSTKIIGLYDLEFTSLQDCLHLIKKNYLNAPQFKRAMNF